MITLDFETEAIEGNPLITPPKPVGLSVKYGESPSEYVTGERMEREWRKALDADEPLLFQNAPFDLSVGEKAFGTPFPHWSRIHDTQYLIFLEDPYQRSLSLKPAAARILDWPPDEQDHLTDWILRNVPGATKKNAGAHISKAPIELVAPYACGDTDRTYGIYDHCSAHCPKEPYDRERRLMPITVGATRHGIRIDVEKLEGHVGIYQAALTECSARIYGKLGKEINIDSDKQLSQALEECGAVTEFMYTEKGAKSVSKVNLEKTCKDKELLDLLAYRSSLSTCLGTFMVPWLEMASADGRVHPNWNQVRETDRKGSGTRTGRLSSDSPNFQNVPNEFDQIIPEGLPDLPMLRLYCLPEEGHVWLKRDFSSQEVRILAHFEDAALAEAYNKNPSLDPHQMASEMIEEITGVHIPRKLVKIIAFTIVYGGGAKAIALRAKCTVDEARRLSSTYLRVFPGVRALQQACNQRGRRRDAIRTWGGRYYHREPHPQFDFSYKLLNYLIQGSAADQTKQVICDWHDQRGEAVFLATVHDEINISAPIGQAGDAMGWLRTAMNQPLFDVPMLSEGFIGANWKELKEND